MAQPKTCILGGTGFVGRRIASHLVARGHQVQVLTRHRERNRDLLVVPYLSVIETDIFDGEALDRQLRGVDTVINLVGILNQSRRKNQTFDQAHVELTRLVGRCIQNNGVPRLLHMSAANAGPDGPSRYLQTKGEAENLAHEHGEHNGYAVTSFRPSVIFGANDSFVNRFASLLKNLPLAFPLACPDSRLQPVYVEDVACCFARAIREIRTFGRRYDLCGPDSFTLFEIVSYIAATLDIDKHIIKQPNWLSKLQASVMQWVPGKPFTPDNYKSLQVASVCDEPFPEVFEITPRGMEEVVPGYLVRQPSKMDLFRKRRV